MSSRINLTCHRLIIAAAVLHLFLAIALFIAGRAGVAPSLIDRDGIMGSFAFDGYKYQRGAIELAELLRSGWVTAWATAAQPVHVKIIAVPFALLSPLFGYSTLSAEPYNLVCYVAIIGLVFALGREVGGQRTGVTAAALVALWPTFLLHTMQLLKDPLFITAVLAFLFCAITSLNRIYQPIASAGVSILGILLVLLLIQVRVSFALLLIVVALLTLMLLVIRQARERRLLVWNMVPALTLLLAAVVLIPFYSHASILRVKRYEFDQAGPLKSVTDPATQVPTLVRWIATPEPNRTNTRGAKFARRISSMRSRFAAAYSESGSLLDANTGFRNVSDLIRYVPRAMEIGLWAPFPYMWISPGRRVGNLGKLLSGIETLSIYFLQALAILAIVREPRQLALWFMLVIVVFGVTALAFVVPNVGAIYRFRYVFWILLVVVAVTGASPQKSTKGTKISGSPFVLFVLFGLLLAVVPGCSSLGQPSHVNDVNLALNNWTGTAFRRLYLSPSSATGWEENVLAGSELKDGDTLDLQFDPKEKNVEWDLRVEGVDGHYAEWKNLKLSEASEVTLVIQSLQVPTVVAELE